MPNRLGPPTSIVNQENAPPSSLQFSLVESFCQWISHFPDIKLAENEPAPVTVDGGVDEVTAGTEGMVARAGQQLVTLHSHAGIRK